MKKILITVAMLAGCQHARKLANHALGDDGACASIANADDSSTLAVLCVLHESAYWCVVDLDSDEVHCNMADRVSHLEKP